MSEPVKPRGYRSPLRERQATETRAVILDAAARHFLAAGFVGTRLGDVAADAGVSLATVKLVFGTKSDLLLALWHRTLAGGLDDQVPVADRDWSRAVHTLDEPVAKIRQLARNSVMVKSRIAALVEVIEGATSADEKLAVLWDRMQREFHDQQRAVVEDLHRGGFLRSDLTVDVAADILWALNHPRTYLLLVRDRGWPAERYEHWMATALERELLAAGR
jgi:AcrR family transcriptional regulator